MDAIEAVVELAKERDELAEEVEIYEDWFESLVGKEVTLCIKNNKKAGGTSFLECLVTEFTPGEGWVLHDNATDDVHIVTFDDFASGNVWVRPENDRPKKKVKFADEDPSYVYAMKNQKF